MSSETITPTITQTPVRPVEEVARCPKDYTALEWTHRSLMTAPPRYPHVCPTCKAAAMLDAVYPRIVYEREGE